MHRRLVGGRPAIAVARLTVLVMALYLAQFAVYVLRGDDLLLLNLRGVDARPVLLVTAAVGVLYAVAWRQAWLRWTWVVAATICTWGRALSLLFIGVPDLSRARQFAGATAWAIAFLAAVLASLVLMAAELLSTDRS